MKKHISFEKLPHWQGVKDSANSFDSFPFSLGWDNKGYIRQTTPKDIQDRIVKLYSDETYSYGTKPPGASEWSDILGNLKSDFIINTFGSLEGKNIAELGAGTLNVAYCLSEKYKINKYIVLDPAIKEQSNNKNILVYRDYFSKENIIEENIDLVLGFSMFEHILDPAGLLNNLYEILIVSKGKLILSFPDIEKPFKDGDLNALLHEHLNYLTATTATALFNRCGFKVLEYESKNDVLWYYLEASHEPYSIEVLENEKSILTDSSDKYFKNIEYVSETLNRYLTAGERVALHGACNGLNNILLLSKINYSDNLFIFDGDKNKRGKFLPVYDTPIRYCEDPEYRTMDKILISALSYYDEIKKYLIEKHGIAASNIQSIYGNNILGM